MNSRERFLACMNFEKVDRAPRWEIGYWGGTIRRWYQEGLPKKWGLPESVAWGDPVIGGIQHRHRLAYARPRCTRLFRFR